MRQLFYYIMQDYYEMCQTFYVTVLLQNTELTTKCDLCYKMRRYTDY